MNYRALVRVDSDQVLSVVSSAYSVVQHHVVAETALALAQTYRADVQIVGGAPIGREGSDAVFVIRVETKPGGALCMLAFNSHGETGAVHFKLIEVDRETGAVLVADTPYTSLKEAHQGNLEQRLLALPTKPRGYDWIQNYINEEGPTEDEMLKRCCTAEQQRDLVGHLWPTKFDWIMSEFGPIHDPRQYLLREPLVESQDVWSVYLRICEYIDQHSEARERGDPTKDRDERLVRGAGDQLKRATWSWLVEKTLS